MQINRIFTIEELKRFVSIQYAEMLKVIAIEYLDVLKFINPTNYEIISKIYNNLSLENIEINVYSKPYVLKPLIGCWIGYITWYNIGYSLKDTGGINQYALQCIYISLKNNRHFEKIKYPRFTTISITNESESVKLVVGSIIFTKSTTCSDFISQIFDATKYIPFKLNVATINIVEAR